jgi:vacuolar-type H+-ATPase subunit I/STV1
MRARTDLRSKKQRKGRPMSTPEEQKKGGNGSAARKAAAEAEAAGGGNLEKIRDILFGAQVHDFEKRFARLEERLMKETSDARAETRKRFESLESFIKKEIESLGERLKAEHEERSEAGKEISRELRDTSRNLDKRIAQLDELTTKNQRELRQQVLDQSKALMEEIRLRNRETTTTLTKEITELRTAKADRAALAGMLTDVAVRLTSDLKAPAKQ